MQTTFACAMAAPLKSRIPQMPIYHLSIKTISRSAGRSATAAAAYRAAAVITDTRTGEHHDYSRKSGVVSAVLFLPKNAPEWATERAALWNAAEAAEKRKNSTVAREFEIALPSELSAAGREALAYRFTHELVKRHGCAADVAIHAPGREGDNRNHHAHILLTTRRLGADGFTEKTRELDDLKTGEVQYWRARYAELQNGMLQAAGIAERVDHRTLEAQGIERTPTKHLGPTATAIERKSGQPSRKRQDWEKATIEKLAAAKEAGDLERQREEAEGSIISLSSDIEQAKALSRDINAGRERVREAYKTQKLLKWHEEHKRQQAEEAQKKEQERKRQEEARIRELQRQSGRGMSM